MAPDPHDRSIAPASQTDRGGAPAAPASKPAKTISRTPDKLLVEKPKESAVEEDLSALGIYFRQMGAVDLMTPDQERAAANRIISHREAYWRAMFAYPPFVDGIIGLIEEFCDEERRPTPRSTSSAAVLARFATERPAPTRKRSPTPSPRPRPGWRWPTPMATRHRR
ncbi:MAG: hypothetical protein K0V04_14695 [Deltaproteobacteria bacterium]|nr:hypothetical protein [Deltaproteobacteria bacterium]